MDPEVFSVAMGTIRLSASRCLLECWLVGNGNCCYKKTGSYVGMTDAIAWGEERRSSAGLLTGRAQPAVPHGEYCTGWGGPPLASEDWRTGQEKDGSGEP
ncbi:hypothetical protein NDU88_005140 [Pleurodeles waltl]|uniref:Uncharacterized protein n=1 Tax=Pleurodeles waltl TaxID=8319 RepID=A0AAV7LK71_PLEWA|nr:hypothetical protein NDU88_005140 [Pleurodeles waltl]